MTFCVKFSIERSRGGFPLYCCRKSRLPIKARSHCTFATAIFLVATDGLYRIQCKCSYCVVATTLLVAMIPLEAKTNRSRKLHSVNGPRESFLHQWIDAQLISVQHCTFRCK